MKRSSDHKPSRATRRTRHELQLLVNREITKTIEASVRPTRALRKWRKTYRANPDVTVRLVAWKVSGNGTPGPIQVIAER